MLGNTTLGTPCGDCLDASLVSLDLRTVCTRSELEEGVKGDVEPWGLLLGFLHEVCVDATEDGLVGDDEDVFGALEFHDDGLETDDNVTVAVGRS